MNDTLYEKINISSLRQGLDLDAAQESNQQKILVVDDEPDTVLLLKHILLQKGYAVAGAYNGREAIGKVSEIKPSLVVLDMMMPEMDGWQTIDKIHEISEVPIVILSAVSQIESIVRALQVGADDYITKPFNQEEVVARIESVLRRAQGNGKIDRIAIDGIQLILDLETREISYKGKRIQLTGKMFEVLKMLMQNAPRLVTYHDMTERIWGEDSPSIRNRLKYLVYLLRQEFANIDPKNNVIDNIGRLGYKLVIQEQRH